MIRKGIGAAAAIFDKAGRVLLVKHTYGRLNWELPGGGAETGESPEQTAIREVREETGLDADPIAMTGVYYDTSNDSVHFVFRCELRPGHSEPTPDGAEISVCRYWPPDALPRPVSDWTVQRILDALTGRVPALPTAIGARLWIE